MRAEKYPASSETFQTISQVEIPGPGFLGMTTGFNLLLALCILDNLKTHQAIPVAAHTPAHTCTSSTPRAVPGQKSTTTQTRTNSRRWGGQQWTAGGKSTVSAHHQHRSTASVHPRLPQRARRGC